MQSLVSVVIPAFNRRAYIAETIQSVLNQTYRHLEVIVVDDGSTDGTGEVVRALAVQDQRVRYIWQYNAERSAARNNGIRHARGDFIAFLDSDDKWYPEKLQLQMELFNRNPEIIMAVTWFEFVNENGESTRLLRQPTKDQTRDADGFYLEQVRENQIASASPVVRRPVFDKSGCFAEDPGLICFEDWDMWTRIAAYGRVGLVPEILVQHRIHRGNTEKRVSSDYYLKVFSHILQQADGSKRRNVYRAGCSGYWNVLRKQAGVGLKSRLNALLKGWSVLKITFLVRTLTHHLRDLCAWLFGDRIWCRIKLAFGKN